MFFILPLIATALSAAAALPGDWARRRAGSTASQLTHLLNLAGLATTLALLVTVGGAHGLLGIGAIAGSLAQGQMLADSAATRIWGTAR